MGLFSNPLKKTKKILKATDPVRRAVTDTRKVIAKTGGNDPASRFASAAVRTGGKYGPSRDSEGNTGINPRTGGGLRAKLKVPGAGVRTGGGLPAKPVTPAPRGVGNGSGAFPRRPGAKVK